MEVCGSVPAVKDHWNSSVLNVAQLQQLISRAALEIAAVETGHSLCSARTLKVVQLRERLFRKDPVWPNEARTPVSGLSGLVLKLRSMQHISNLPPP